MEMVDWLAGWLVDFWIVVWVGGRSDEHYVFCEALVVKGEGGGGVYVYMDGGGGGVDTHTDVIELETGVVWNRESGAISRVRVMFCAWLLGDDEQSTD